MATQSHFYSDWAPITASGVEAGKITEMKRCRIDEVRASPRDHFIPTKHLDSTGNNERGRPPFSQVLGYTKGKACLSAELHVKGAGTMEFFQMLLTQFTRCSSILPIGCGLREVQQT